VTDGQIRSSSVGAIEVCPTNPDIVYIGMGEVELRGNVIPGDGVYKTTDGGKTWKHVGLADRVRRATARHNLAWVGYGDQGRFGYWDRRHGRRY
jgi:hypothetical protein